MNDADFELARFMYRLTRDWRARDQLLLDSSIREYEKAREQFIAAGATEADLNQH